LYKYHLIHQCPRCKELFDSEDDVKSHLEATQACNAKPPIVVDGVTKAMQEQIKSRKRAFKGQTELNRWEQIYQILFPGEILPDPRADSFLSSNYARHALNSVDFEAVEDREMKLKEDQTTGNISDFQEHLLAQLPRLFDRSLVLASGFDLPPVEDELRRRASTLFQEALTAMLSSYRSSLNQITGEATSPNMQLTAQIPSEAPNRSFANLAISATGSADSGYLSQHAGNDFVVPCPQDREQYLGALMPDSMGQGRHIPAHEMPPSAPRVALTRNGTSQTAGNAESSGEGPIVQELDGFESHLETSGMNPLAANGVVFVVPGSLPDSWLGRGVSDVMDEWMSWNESQN
jgi:hypothetical protein